jgi:hypothetical protein
MRRSQAESPQFLTLDRLFFDASSNTFQGNGKLAAAMIRPPRCVNLIRDICGDLNLNPTGKCNFASLEPPLAVAVVV